MTEEKRQELFQDAEPAADGGQFRLVAGVMGVAVLLAVGWIAVSLEHLKDELSSLEEEQSGEMAVLSAELAALKQETGEEFHSVKGTLSGIWHRHKPAELEVMGFLASRNAEEREGPWLISRRRHLVRRGRAGGLVGAVYGKPATAAGRHACRGASGAGHRLAARVCEYE